MININPIINTKDLFKRNNNEKISVENNSIERNSIGYSTKAISSYGKALIFRGENPKTYDEKLDEIDLVSDEDTLSLQESVDMLKSVKMANDKKVDALMLCCFETNNSDIVISKKALMLIIANAEHKKIFPKTLDAIKTCMDDETQTFDYDRYNSMIDYKGRVKLSAKLYNDVSTVVHRGYKTERKYEIIRALDDSVEKKEEIKKVEIKYADVFKPLSESKKELLSDLNDLKEGKEIPEELYKQLKNSIKDDKFNFKEIYKQYYQPLNDISTIEEVNKRYPEIFIPEKPINVNSNIGDSLAYRLSNEDYDSISLDIIRQAYCGYKPKSKIFVKLQNSNPTSLHSLHLAGFNYSLPSDSVKNFIKEGETLRGKIKTIQELPPERIKEMSEKNAVWNSNIWTDHINATKGLWLPIRLIRAKRRNPDNSKYSTPHLVDTYIFGLYRENPDKIYEKNPLKEYDDKQIFSKEMSSVVNKIYKNRYYETQQDMRFGRNLAVFASQFDKKAIGQSIEKMEKKYSNYFYSQYLTKEKMEVLQKEVKKSYDIALEKYNLNTKNPKIIDITEDDIIDEVSEKLFETKE